MLGTIYTSESRDAWAMVPGRSIEITNNANNKPTQIDYYEGTTLVFSQLFTYDANGNMIKLECVAP